MIHVCSSSECDKVFKKYADRNSDGGEGKEDLDTLQKCKDGCEDNSNCVGLDWDDSADTKCWLHMDIANFDETEDNTNVDQYRLECDDNGTCVCVCVFINIMIEE